MRAANCVKFCLNPFYLEVHENCLPWDKTIQIKPYTIDSFHIVSAHAPNSLVPRYLREITLEGATFIRLPMHYTIEYENGE